MNQTFVRNIFIFSQAFITASTSSELANLKPTFSTVTAIRSSYWQPNPFHVFLSDANTLYGKNKFSNNKNNNISITKDTKRFGGKLP